MMMFAKSEKLKTIGRLSIAGNIFGINEPILFSCIVLNPTMLIPFVVSPFVNLSLTYFLTEIGILPHLIGYSMPFTMPVIVSGFVQGGIAIVLAQVVTLILSAIIYYPFFRVMDKQALEEEQALENN